MIITILNYGISCLIYVRLIDESLRWLIANGKVDQAKDMIKKACKTNKKNYNEIVTVSGFRGMNDSFLVLP